MSILYNQLGGFGNPFQALGPDFYGYILPWIFTFAIVYGLLANLNLFKDQKRIPAALAFVIAFFVTGVGGPQLATFFTTLFGGASVFLAGILVIILFAALLGFKGDKEHGGVLHHTGALVAVIIIGAALFVGSTGNFTGGQIYITQGVASMLFWLLILIVAIWFVMQEEKKPEAPAKKTE
ncbi:MAG: hypothetical protein HY832_00215 [Candidatus Aenigmarchaeota archaeon]|nr:hypothetical protein [Candidatus Aenigmarchaeota archaeon]